MSGMMEIGPARTKHAPLAHFSAVNENLRGFKDVMGPDDEQSGGDGAGDGGEGQRSFRTGPKYASTTMPEAVAAFLTTPTAFSKSEDKWYKKQ